MPANPECMQRDFPVHLFQRKWVLSGLWRLEGMLETMQSVPRLLFGVWGLRALSVVVRRIWEKRVKTWIPCSGSTASP